jgi:hypothetical protein
VPAVEKLLMLALQHFEPVGNAVYQLAEFLGVRPAVICRPIFLAAAPSVVLPQPFALLHFVTP